jgi:TnpA family transposase
MAHACGIPEGQLRRVYEWYFHEDALRQAITKVIRYHGTLPLTALLGSGHTSSSDGIRFGAASSALNARHLPRYFGMRLGLTLYSHVLDQGTQYWVDMVNCQLREATFVLDGLLYQDAPAITEHYVDAHGATELVFGLFALLRFRFSPRLADLPDQVLYRGIKGADYGVLNPVIRQSVRGPLIVSEWEDLNRPAASLKDGLARPSLIVSRLQAMRRLNPLQQAIQELGRIEKTRHILTIADDPAARRRMLVGLNKQELLHSMARVVSFGRQGRFGDRGYEAQLGRASCLSLVLNACIVWTTRYLWAAAEELARRGQPVSEEAWQHLTAILWEHIGLVGDYSFEERTFGDGLRPLRTGEA